MTSKTERELEFDALYNAYYNYVFKYHVYGHVEDFNPDNPLPYIDKESFKEQLSDDGMMIKVREGY